MLFMLCLTIWLSPGCAEAFGYNVDGSNIYGHQSPDGAISYFVTDERGTWSLKGDYARLSLYKVFPANGSEILYYFFVEAADAKVKKNPVTDVVFFINGRAVDSEPFPGTAAITRDKIFRGWYKLPAGIEKVLALEGFENVDRSQYSFVTIATRPYQDGVWVNMSLMRKKYGKNKHYYLEYDAGSSGLVSMRSYWRSKAEDWAQLLLDVQHEFHGRYDYGITWKKETDAEGKEGSLFRIQAVDAVGFPALNDIAAGDALVAVNGVATSFMKPLDLNYLLDANGEPVVLTIKTKNNEEKKIAVTPQFKPSPPMAKDYKTMIGPVSKRFVKVEKRGLKFAVEPSFYPLEIAWGLP